MEIGNSPKILGNCHFSIAPIDSNISLESFNLLRTDGVSNLLRIPRILLAL